MTLAPSRRIAPDLWVLEHSPLRLVVHQLPSPYLSELSASL
jgi:hypothetical protein